jgi:phosphoribosyl-AMP cyclohydrolase
MARFDIASVKFDAAGLVPAIAQARDGEVLMLAWMNAESLAETLASGQVTYWSRSRAELWRKGATSGCSSSSTRPGPRATPTGRVASIQRCARARR